ncbi:hypothetical protein B224_5546 [Aeromonas media WS]|nr:hypothetical protein B224_5546 [Aeromonas media WS]
MAVHLWSLWSGPGQRAGARRCRRSGVCPGGTQGTSRATVARAGWRHKAPGVSTI